MCGIVGYTGERAAGPLLLEGLARLEYRGYDSAGIALLTPDALIVERRAGRLANLRAALAEGVPEARAGIAHTRWATHGAPNEANAHPHRDCSGQIAVVHNGIIENWTALRDELAARGHTFTSETDSETVAHLLEETYDGDLRAALLAVLPRLQGAFALAVVHAAEAARLLGARRGSPLVAGIAADGALLASDALALAGRADLITHLLDGDVVELTPSGLVICDERGRPQSRPLEAAAIDPATIEKDGHPHYMFKELFETPAALAAALEGRIDERVHLPELEPLLGAIRGATRVEIVACGSAHYAALVAAPLLERWSGLPVRCSVASEWRYAEPRLGPDVLVIAVSQSGETADTLGAVRLARSGGSPCIALVNTAGSSLTREADAVILLHAGPEIAVAATKSFAVQAAVGVALAARIGAIRGVLPAEQERTIAAALAALPAAAALALEWSDAARSVAHRLLDAVGFLYLGRGPGLPAALEGALKMKEVGCLHADGYPAGELKHGPIALVEPTRPVVAVVSPGVTHAKTIGNLEECRARGGRIIAVGALADHELAGLAETVLPLPPAPEFLLSILAAIPLARLAYEHAVARGLDVDQPRNLAKSVTVE